jgi:transposase InsO family protein
MWVWALRGSRHFKPMSYSVWPHWPHRGELIIVSLERQGEACTTRLQAGKAHGDLPLLPAPSVPQGVETVPVSAEGQEGPSLQPGLLHKHRLHPDRGKGTPTLATVIDRFSRYIVSWKPFDTMCDKEVATCARQAFAKHGLLFHHEL